MKISVIGAGYVGLSNALLISEKYKVNIIDKDPNKIQLLSNFNSYLNEHEIQKILLKNKHNLKFYSEIEDGVKNTDIIIICLPTNYSAKKKRFDTSIIEKTITKLNELSFSGLIVLRSTVPIGYTEKLLKRFSKLDIAFFPEFLREGKAMHDSFYPSRIVCGASSQTAEKFSNILVNCSKKKNIDVLVTTPSEAEAIKLFANTYLAMRISFFNELDSFSMINKLNARKIINGVSLDDRIGSHYNNPSFGYGGYCLPKDTKQLESEYGKIPNALISAIALSNEKRKKLIIKEILKLKPKKIGIYRLIMKSESDNFRESSILDIVDGLNLDSNEIIIHEPLIEKDYYKEFKVVNDFDRFTDVSDLIITNRHSKNLDKFSYKVFSRDIFRQN